MSQARSSFMLKYEKQNFRRSGLQSFYRFWVTKFQAFFLEFSDQLKRFHAKINLKFNHWSSLKICSLLTDAQWFPTCFNLFPTPMFVFLSRFFFFWKIPNGLQTKAGIAHFSILFLHLEKVFENVNTFPDSHNSVGTLGLKRGVVSHQVGLSSGSSLRRVVSHQVVFQQDDLSSGFPPWVSHCGFSGSAVGGNWWATRRVKEKSTKGDSGRKRHRKQIRNCLTSGLIDS